MNCFYTLHSKTNNCTVNCLANESIVELCMNIRQTLEDLVEKWSKSIDKENIPVPMDLPGFHDGIDSVVQSIEALRCKFYTLKYVRTYGS